MLRFALSLALLVATIAPASAQIVVRGDWIALGDLARVNGEAAKALVSPAPPPGQKLALDPAFLNNIAKSHGVDALFALDMPVWVTRAANEAPKAPVAPQAPVAGALGGAKPQEMQVLVLLRDVARGERIGANDIGWAKPQAGATPRNAATDPSAAIGLEAKRILKSGQPLSLNDIAAPHVVRKGDRVKLVYTSAGLKLAVDGLAQSDAAKGESVRVLNQYSKRTIDAVASGEGEARVKGR